MLDPRGKFKQVQYETFEVGAGDDYVLKVRLWHAWHERYDPEVATLLVEVLFARDGSGRHLAGFGLRAGPRARSQIPKLPTNPELTKDETNLCADCCRSLPTHGRNTVISVLFILSLLLSRCQFSETIAIRASLAGFGLYGPDTNRFRTAGSRARARPESIPTFCHLPVLIPKV